MHAKPDRRCFGIIGGLGALGGADLFFKLVKSTPVQNGKGLFDIVFEQHPFAEGEVAGAADADAHARKLYVFDCIREFEARGIAAVVLPCFLSHTFIRELQGATRLPIVDMLAALREHIRVKYPQARRLGILTSSLARHKGLFEQYFDKADFELIYPEPQAQESLMAAIYGENGIKSGKLQGATLAQLQTVGETLLARGAELLVPGFTEIAIVIDALLERGLPIVDSNLAYARHIVAGETQEEKPRFKIGIIGGVGPAATTDFMDKVFLHTQARRDQDHLQMIVEHNPKIPDRTEHLLGNGSDPTIALYAACKKLEANEANIIAIPCNTAHAFVERIQPYLGIPIVNMLSETIAYLTRQHPARQRVGLLATTGTVQSGIYHELAIAAGLKLIQPDATHQALVMQAIYGEQGVKAGFREGICQSHLHAALVHLVEQGVEAVILGCTELPILLAQSDAYSVAGRTIVVLDPTEILARKCVSLAKQGDAPDLAAQP